MWQKKRYRNVNIFQYHAALVPCLCLFNNNWDIVTSCNCQCWLLPWANTFYIPVLWDGLTLMSSGTFAAWHSTRSVHYDLRENVLDVRGMHRILRCDGIIVTAEPLNFRILFGKSVWCGLIVSGWSLICLHNVSIGTATDLACRINVSLLKTNGIQYCLRHQLKSFHISGEISLTTSLRPVCGCLHIESVPAVWTGQWLSDH